MKNEGIAIGAILLIVVGTIFFINKGTSEPPSTSQSGDTSGIEIFITDAPSDNLQHLDMIIEKIELVGQVQTRTILSSQSQLRLKEMLVQKVVGDLIPKDQYRYMNVYFKNIATATMNDGTTKQIQVRNQVMKVDINKGVLDDEILTLMIDIPLSDSIEMEGSEYVFEAKQVKLQSQKRTQAREQIKSQVRENINQRIQFTESASDKGVNEIIDNYRIQKGNN